MAVEELETNEQTTPLLDDEGVYQELLKRSDGNFTGNEETIKRFEPLYKKLHSLATQIGSAYSDVSKLYGLNPGKIDIVLGGGRAKGKPFKEDSDLDIFFYIENPSENLDSLPLAKYPKDPLRAMDEQNIKMQTPIRTKHY
jgi:hypothetical protein